jgi:IS30 family transposase
MSRIAISVCEQKEIWNRFKNGESVTDIAQYLERSYSTCLNTIKSNGGIKPHFQQRSSKQLSIREREEISRLLALGLSIRKIAKAIGRSPSTISREINRNGTKETYRAIDADKSAYIRAKRVQECKLSTNGKLRIVVSNKLKKRLVSQSDI